MELGELWREDRKSSHESGRRYMSLRRQMTGTWYQIFSSYIIGSFKRCREHEGNGSPVTFQPLGSEV